MNVLFATVLSLSNLNSPLPELSPQNIKPVKSIEKNDSSEHLQSPINQLCNNLSQNFNDSVQWEEFTCNSHENLLPGDLLLFGSPEDVLQTLGIYLGEDKFIQVDGSGKICDSISQLSDPEWSQSLHSARRMGQNEENENQEILDGKIEDSAKVIYAAAPSFLDEHFTSYFLNEQKMPLVVSPKDPHISLSFFQAWANAHQIELKSLLSEYGVLLLRDFPVETPEEFAAVVKAVVGSELRSYKGGEGSRKKITEGVYTSTEAPPQFKIPLHNELTCTNDPNSYICFYCEIAPEPGSGQTILGRTDQVSAEILQNHPDLWNFFNGHNIKYISRHPPEGSFFSKVNKTHKTWPQAFETTDKQEVERICKERGFEFRWVGEWIEVIRLAPAIREPDEYFDHPYWYNQVHLYHSNPRIHGGWLNHILARILYISPSTRNYDVELEDGSSIPQNLVYQIYDVMEKNTIKFDWQKEDVLLLDNRKALHGRAPYIGNRRILVSMVQ